MAYLRMLRLLHGVQRDRLTGLTIVARRLLTWWRTRAGVNDNASERPELALHDR